MSHQKVPRGQQIPPKMWMLATHAKAEFCTAGEAWVDAGRPRHGVLYDKFCSAEKQYNHWADLIWFASWTDEQRKEWEQISK